MTRPLLLGTIQQLTTSPDCCGVVFDRTGLVRPCKHAGQCANCPVLAVWTTATAKGETPTEAARRFCREAKEDLS